MTQNSQKQTEKPILTGDLHPKEVELIRLMRQKYRFGRIVVVVHDGIPQKIEQTVEYQQL